MKVELIYEKTCPNIEAARTQIKRAFADHGAHAQWQEWEISDPLSPDYAHGYGSPTVLVDGKDVTGAEPTNDDSCCRIYTLASSRENQGVPAVAQIVAALAAASTPPAGTPGLRKNFVLLLNVFPTVLIALLPKLFCPACWPAYAGLLSSVGLGFFDYTPYRAPALGVFVAIALGALVFQAPRRRGYRPFLVGIFASIVLLSAKFYWDNDLMMWIGLSLLVAASLWNSWPKKVLDGECPACQG